MIISMLFKVLKGFKYDNNLSAFMMKKILILAVVSFLFSALFGSFVSADSIMPGFKSVKYCFQIENMDDYPEYAFILGFETQPIQDRRLILSGECVGFYKYASPTVYAVRKELVNSSYFNLSEQDRAYLFSKEGNPLDAIEEVIPSGITLEHFGTVRDDNPVKEVVDVLAIRSVDDNRLDLRKSKIIYTYTDGSSEEKPYELQSKTPEPTRKSNSYLFFIILPIIAFAIIIITLVKRR